MYILQNISNNTRRFTSCYCCICCIYSLHAINMKATLHFDINTAFPTQALRKDGWLHFRILSRRALTFVNRGNVEISSNRPRYMCIIMWAFELLYCLDVILILHSQADLHHQRQSGETRAQADNKLCITQPSLDNTEDTAMA